MILLLVTAVEASEADTHTGVAWPGHDEMDAAESSSGISGIKIIGIGTDVREEKRLGGNNLDR